MKEKIILVVKMYTGEYIEKNIGHEIINFFKPDSGDKYYGYIINKGKLRGENYNKIQTIIFVSNKQNNKVKILAKIEKDKDELEFIVDKEAPNKELQEKFICSNNIRYGNVLLNEIMDKNVLDAYGIYISFSANKVHKITNDYYLLFNSSNGNEDDKNIKINSDIGHQFSYISNKDNKEDYEKLNKLIKENIWGEIPEVKINENILNKYDKIYNELYDNKDSFMDIINRNYDENVFSNMLYYYFDKKKMFKDFAEYLLNIEISNNAEIIREKNTGNGKIDIWVKDDINKRCIIIENKLKSGINGRHIDDDYKNKKVNLEDGQLFKYKKWAEKNYNDYERSYFIFVPNYKKEELNEDIIDNDLMPRDIKGEDLYKIVTYKDIFEFFYNQKDNVKKDKYYNDFLKALSTHTYTKEQDMERKFVYAIKSAKK